MNHNQSPLKFCDQNNHDTNSNPHMFQANEMHFHPPSEKEQLILKDSGSQTEPYQYSLKNILYWSLFFLMLALLPGFRRVISCLLELDEQYYYTGLNATEVNFLHEQLSLIKNTMTLGLSEFQDSWHSAAIHILSVTAASKIFINYNWPLMNISASANEFKNIKIF